MVRHYLLKSFILGLLLVCSVNAQEMDKLAPSCDLAPLGEDTAFNLQQYKGKVVYVDFWASWCGPCAQSFPFLNTLHEQYQAKGLQIVAINLDENADDAKAFLAKFPAKFMVAADKGQSCATGFAVEAMPSSYLLDKKGHIRFLHMGFRAGETDDIKAKVEQLLGEN